MKRAIFAVNIALGAAVLMTAAFAAREAVVLKYGQKEAREETQAVRHEEAALTLSEYGRVVQGGLFGRGSLSPLEASGNEIAGLVLVGTAEGVGYAIFMDTGTGVQRAFRKGESVFGAGVVADISTKRAELESGGRRMTFKVPSTMPADGARPKAQQKAELATRKGEGQWAVDQRAVAGMFDNMDKVLTDARFKPFNENGKLNGFQASELKPGGVFDLIGLKDGDVVLSINDYKLDSPGKVAQVLGALKGETEVKVDILRGNQPRTLKYQIR